MQKPSWKYEKEYWREGREFVIGVDEVGYGSWAGPIVVGAVVFPVDTLIYGLRDSKQLKAVERKKLTKKILRTAIDVGVGEGSVQEINDVGLATARQNAFDRALEKMRVMPDIVLIDGVVVSCPHQIRVITKGDQKVPTIAAASIIAKVYRDRMMTSLHRLYRNYGWNKNKGYGTKHHLEMIKQNGLTAQHRVNYKCFNKLDLEA